MKIGGFVKQSLIDFPGHIAAMIFTSGCNFRCGYCHNPQLVLAEYLKESENLSQEFITEYLRKRKGWLDAVVISGGEPCIHSDLPEWLAELKSMGYLIKLDTNGSHPEMLDSLLKNNLIDFIAMDIKHIPQTAEYSQIIGLKQEDIPMLHIQRSIQLIQTANIPHEFRTTVLPQIHKKEDLLLTEKILKEKIKIQNFRDGQTIEKCRA